MLRLDVGELHEGASHLAGCGAAEDLAALRRMATAAISVGSPTVEMALQAAMHTCAAAAQVLIESCRLGAQSARDIADGLVGVDEVAGLAADRLLARRVSP